MLWSINIWQTIKLQWRSTLCDKVCQLLTTGWWFSLGTTVSSTNKTYRYDITEILLKVVINTINQPMFFFTQRQTIIFTWKQKPDYYFFFFLHEKSMIFPKILSKVSSRCKLQVRSIILQLLGQFILFFFCYKIWWQNFVQMISIVICHGLFLCSVSWDECWLFVLTITI